MIRALNSKIGAAGSKIGAAGSKIGAAGSKIGVAGSKIGAAGSKIGVAGSKIGVARRPDRRGNLIGTMHRGRINHLHKSVHALETELCPQKAAAYSNCDALLPSQWTTTAPCSWRIAATIGSCAGHQLPRREASWLVAMAKAPAYINWHALLA